MMMGYSFFLTLMWVVLSSCGYAMGPSDDQSEVRQPSLRQESVVPPVPEQHFDTWLQSKHPVESQQVGKKKQRENLSLKLSSRKLQNDEANKKNRLYVCIDERETEDPLTLTANLLKVIQSRACPIICSADSLSDLLENYKGHIFTDLVRHWDIISIHNTNLMLLVPHELKYYKFYDGKNVVNIPRIVPGSLDVQWSQNMARGNKADDIIAWLYQQKFKGDRNDAAEKRHLFKTGITWSDIRHLFTFYLHDFTVMQLYDQSLKNVAADQATVTSAVGSENTLQKSSRWGALKQFFVRAEQLTGAEEEKNLLADYFEDPHQYEEKVLEVIVNRQEALQQGVDREYFQKKMLSLLKSLQTLAQNIKQANKNYTSAQVFSVIRQLIEQEFFFHNKWNIMMLGHGREHDSSEESTMIGMPLPEGVALLRDLQALPIYSVSILSCFLGGKNKQSLYNSMVESHQRDSFQGAYNYHIIILSITDAPTGLLVDCDLNAYFSLLEHRLQIDFAYLNYFLAAPAPYYLLSNYPQVLYAGAASFKTLHLPQHYSSQLPEFIQKAIKGYAAFSLTTQMLDTAVKNGNTRIEIAGKSGLLIYPGFIAMPLVIQSQKIFFEPKSPRYEMFLKKILNKYFFYYYSPARKGQQGTMFYAPFPTTWDLSFRDHYGYLFPIIIAMDSELPVTFLNQVILQGASLHEARYSYKDFTKGNHALVAPHAQKVKKPESVVSIFNAGILTFLTQSLIASFVQHNKHCAYIKELVGMNDFNAIFDHLGTEAIERNRELYESLAAYSNQEIILKNVLIVTGGRTNFTPEPIQIYFEYNNTKFSCVIDFPISPHAIYNPGTEKLNWHFQPSQQSASVLLNAALATASLDLGKLIELLQKSDSLKALIAVSTLFKIALHNKDFRAIEQLLAIPDKRLVLDCLALRDRHNKTLLHLLVEQNNSAGLKKVFDFLVYQADDHKDLVCALVMAQDYWSRTLLHYAVMRHNSDIVQVIFEAIKKISDQLLVDLMSVVDQSDRRLLDDVYRTHNTNFIEMFLKNIEGYVELLPPRSVEMNELAVFYP